MASKTQEQADRLYERGLRIFSRYSDTASLKFASELWQKAWELYRNAGNESKARELEKSLVQLYKKRFAQSSEKKTEHDHITGKNTEWDVFLKTGCFGFGGPMAVFALLEDELVHRRKILTHDDFLEAAVLGDVLPGPVTMDIVTYTGYKLNKWRGAAISTAVFILPSFVLMLILAMLYDKYSVTPRISVMLSCLGAAVTGLIVSVGLKLSKAEVKDYREACILIWAFASALVFKLDIVVIVGIAGLIGMVLYRVDDVKQPAKS